MIISQKYYRIKTESIKSEHWFDSNARTNYKILINFGKFFLSGTNLLVYFLITKNRGIKQKRGMIISNISTTKQSKNDLERIIGYKVKNLLRIFHHTELNLQLQKVSQTH